MIKRKTKQKRARDNHKIIQIDRQTNRRIEKQTDRKTDGLTNRHRQTNRQRYKLTCFIGQSIHVCRLVVSGQLVDQTHRSFF
jgi:hypothetical protein